MLTVAKIAARCSAPLIPLERALTRRHVRSPEPIVFIVGLPRCGSTLFQQLMGRHTNIGYVSNVHARFWRTPYLGALFASRLRPSVLHTGFSSHLGITADPWESNEWGWYWRRMLDVDAATGRPREGNDLDDRIVAIGRDAAAMASAYRAPMMFKNIFVMPVIRRIADKLENARFVWLERDPFYVANSIANATLLRYGGLTHWFGPRPRNSAELESLPSLDRIAAQVDLVNEELNEQFAGVASERLIRVNYDELLSAPRELVDRFCDWIEAADGSLRRTNHDYPSGFTNRNAKTYLNPNFATEFEAAFARRRNSVGNTASEANPAPRIEPYRLERAFNA